ncbi:Hsp70 family protein [Amycolatopsis alba]|uniref:Hsp70 family protein n=1 Tax=Amycolatopsis alba DSM 44262 TaxID=1125972 RepID=A0A229RK50_AMYAL|nr:Hsp70 family protein [Amycolatopsis alba]OXM47048.1 hsp70 family protein [Amycolatopsis alba DSM 44262]
MPAKTTFGIDLGTTHSCIASVDEAGKAAVIRNVLGEETTPSVVYFEASEQATVGTSAKNAAVLAPHLVAQLTKRFIGERKIAGHYHGKDYSPEEIGALILRELVRATKETTGKVVEDVVITVPAYFGVAQKEATRRAGEIAGLRVLDVLPEPVAAALHYQTLDTGTGTRHLLVCDLGGGTFDTTVIRLEGDDVRVLCTGGDGRLGGADWDERVRTHLLGCFTEQHPHLDPTKDEAFLQDLATTAEQLKKDLSKTEARRTALHFGGAVTRVELTREKLEELTSDLLDRVVQVAEQTVETAKAKGVERFDDVVLVGGMSKMPAVAERLERRLGLRGRHHEPDLTVAKGAALHAVLNQVKTGMAADRVAEQLGMSQERVEALAAKQVTTVVSKAFGVIAVDPRDPLALTDPLHARKMVVHLLAANTPLPADTGPYPFAVAVDKQRMVEIEVWEQTSEVESEEPSDNVRIGRGLLRNLPPRPAGSPFDVTFLMSETGKLTVHAEEPSSGAEVRFELQIGAMSQAAVAAARTGIARHVVRD